MLNALRDRLAFALRSLFKRRAKERELQLEMEEHIELRTEELVTRGLSEKEARRQTLVEFGGLEQMKEGCRESWRIMAVDGLIKDLRFAFRMIAKQKLFSLISIVTLSIGMAVFITFFSLVDMAGNLVLMKGDTDYHVLKWGRTGDLDRKNLASHEIPYLEVLSENFETISISYSRKGSVRSEESDAQLRTLHFASNFGMEQIMDQLHVHPAAGRVLLEEDYEEAAPLAAMTSRRLAADLFESAGGAIGKILWIDGQPCRIVGVWPDEHLGLALTDVWLPLKKADLAFSKPIENINAGGKLRRDRGSGQVAAQARSIGESIMSDFPNERPEDSFLELLPMEEAMIPDFIRNLVYMVFFALGLFLCLTCANVSILTLSRSAQRQRELAIRGALGATRGRIVTQALIESFCLSLGGLVLGGLFAYRILDTIAGFVESQARVPIRSAFEFNWAYGALFVGLAILVTLLCGWAPARRVMNKDIYDVLRSDGRSSSQRLGSLSRLMASVQIAIGCGLVVGFNQALFTIVPVLLNSGLNIESDDVLAIQLHEKSAAQLASLYQQAKDSLEALPEIETVAVADSRLMDASKKRVSLKLSVEPESGRKRLVARKAISNNYFDTFDLEVIRGRSFLESDAMNSEPVAIVNRRFAERFFPESDCIGERFFEYDENEETRWLRIVGIAPDMQMSGVINDKASRPGYYVPFAQSSISQAYLAIEPRAGSPSVVDHIRQAFRRINPDQPIDRIVHAADHAKTQLTIVRSLFGSILALKGLSVFLASIGVFGMMRYAVKQRTKEIGVRVALGANRGRISWLVIRQGLKQISLGLLSGAAVGVVLNFAFLSIFGMASSGSPVFSKTACLAILLFGSVASMAMAIPAWTAMRIQPMDALRCD